ncbi:MAG TPA: hypothetical protein VFB21_26315 [Chthonomonadaceae bacterium]|nr:hypothetical protein [Chthonomonadaceae bacterium]
MIPGFDWDAPLPDSARDAMIESLAQKVARRNLHLPAILFLEMHRPLTFFASQGLLLSSGFLAPLFGPQNVQRYAKLLESRENVERLLQRIEELAEGKATGEG